MSGQTKAMAAKAALERQKSKVSNEVNTKINKELDKIRNAKRENLLIFDSNGNVVASEKGNKYHTGYNQSEYKDRIVAHNHPETVYPYPTERDFSTAEKSGMKEMIVVSKNYTVRYSIDENYKGYGRQGLSYNIEQNSSKLSQIKSDINNQTIKAYKEGKYKSQSEYKTDTLNKQTEAILKEYKNLCKNSGYKMSYERNDK